MGKGKDRDIAELQRRKMNERRREEPGGRNVDKSELGLSEIV